MQKFHTDDVSLLRSGGACHWFSNRDIFFNQSEAFLINVYWHVISMEFLQLFLKCHFPWKPVVASLFSQGRPDIIQQALHCVRRLIGRNLLR